MIQISWSTETNLFDGTGVTVLEQTFHLLEFDAVLSETHETRAEVTEHTVEEGSPISDHKRAKPALITIEGLVTNTPLDVPPSSGFAETTVTVSVSKDGAQVRTFSGEFDRVRDVWATLDRLALEDIPVGLSTRSKDYEGLQVLSVTLPRDNADDAGTFTIELGSVRVAVSRTVDTPAPREPRGAADSDRGAREGEETPRLRSTLDSLGEAAVSALFG